MPHSFLVRLTSHIPPGQFARYLVAGVWNTAFGYGTFALFTWMLDDHIPASYMAGALLSCVLGITQSFLAFKWFVFKTKGNYLREWARCFVVYGGSVLVGLALLPPTVFVVSYVTGNPRAAPYIAGVLIMGVQVTMNFVGHLKYLIPASRRQQ